MEMRLLFLIIVLLVNSYRVESETICNVDFCSCEYDGGNVTVDCSSGQRALASNLSVPNLTVTLDLTKSNIKYVYISELLKSNTVEELLLNNNNLHELKGSLFQLPELKRLDLSNNCLEVIKHEVFVDIIKLEYLNLENNKFTLISQVRFHPLVNLKEIILDNNNVGADLQNTSLFDVNGCGLTKKIQSISLREIGLGNLDQDYFRSARSLTNLTVSKNNLTQIFTLPYYLFYFDLSDNPIKSLEHNDPMGPLLRVLRVNNLEIEELPNGIFLGQFDELQLEGNKHLSKFNKFAFGRNMFRDEFDFSLENISIRYSNISTLDEKLWILFRKVKRLDFQDNPWNCDCRIAWFLKLTIPQDLTEDLRCASPPRLNNSRIFDLRLKDFICLVTPSDGPSANGIEVPVGVVLFSLFVIIMLTWILIVIVYVPRRAVKKKSFSKL